MNNIEVRSVRTRTGLDSNRRPHKDEVIHEIVDVIEKIMLQGTFVSASLLGDKVEFFAMHERQKILR